MKIVVPIKQILDPKGLTIRRDKERIFVNVKEYIIDPASKAAIEAALRVKDALTAEGSDGNDVTIIALCLGESRADDALREAMATGCDAAYLISDKAFDGADVAVTARALAAAVEKLGGVDLVVAGGRSGDTGAGQVGPRLADALGYAQVTDCISVVVQGGTARTIRHWGDGYAQVDAALPTVVTVALQAFQPRYAHGARIMTAYQQWEVTAWDATELGMEETALAPVVRFRGESFPPPLEVGEVFRGEPDAVGPEVVSALKLQRLIS